MILITLYNCNVNKSITIMFLIFFSKAQIFLQWDFESLTSWIVIISCNITERSVRSQLAITPFVCPLVTLQLPDWSNFLRAFTSRVLGLGDLFPSSSSAWKCSSLGKVWREYSLTWDLISSSLSVSLLVLFLMRRPRWGRAYLGWFLLLNFTAL